MADVKVNLAFTADTSQAISAVQKLQQTLSQLSASGVKGTMTKEMEQASAAAKELSYHLNQAFNAKTGNFDLSRLDRSLKASGTNVDALSTKLLGAGQQGQQAFIQLAQSISLADRPMITLSSRLTGLFTTLKNTAKWQISSTILHGFMGAVQQAYGYAQDLNESLNNIRIVTGYDTDKMAQFAQEANKAAKALSTTTTAYTDASLIYYQQGLGDKEVKERTDVTVKLANVSRQSAEEVSSQMTAIWNNFDNGSKSLEYYADAITALGAKTASSSAEIAEGLQKFAAVSETVGLSYEYATSALATVVAQTRQSADTVGTAFKTMFARIQGLKLGETLEDGTTFNQYSEALYSIGVNIKDANGNLKDMDNILDEMGAKWKDLNRDEQVAVAQKVAGIRQYQQLISLMDSYDIFKENVDVASGSTGTLQKQADIYAESWEAASKRVKASAQALYSDLLDDKFFIKATDGISKLLDSIDAFIDGMGGIGPVLIGIGSIFLNIFANKIPSVLNNLKANLAIVFQGAAKSASQLTLAMNASSIDALYSSQGATMNDSMKQALSNTIALTTAKNKLSAVSKDLTQEELQGAQATLSYIQESQKELQVLADKITQRKANIDALKNEIDLEAGLNTTGKSRATKEKQLQAAYEKAESNYAEDTSGDNLKKINEAQKALQSYRQNTVEAAEVLETYTNKLAQAYIEQLKLANGAELSSSEIIELGECFTPFIEKINNLETIGDFKVLKQSVIDLESQLNMAVGDTIPGLQEALQAAVRAPNTTILINAIKRVQQILKEAKVSADQLPESLKGIGQQKLVDNATREYKGLKEEIKDLTAKQETLNQKVREFNPQHIRTGLEKITQTAAGFGQLYMAVSAVKSLFDAWNNEDLSFGEKLMTSMMSISMLIPGLIGAFSSFGKVLNVSAIMEQAYATAAYNSASALGFKITVEQSEQALQKLGIAQDQIEILMSKEKTGATLEELAADEAIKASTLAKILMSKLHLSAEQAQLVIQELKTGKTLEEALAVAGVTAAEGSAVPVKIAHALATAMQKYETEGLLAAMTPLLPIIAAFIGVLAGAAAIIAGVAFAIKALKDEANKYSDATKETQERVEEFTNQLQEAKTEAENLKTTMSNWDSAIQALSELDKHTEEYANKLKEANRQAQELIETYGLYDQYVIENGQIKFNQGVLEKLQQDADNKVKVIEDYLSAAKIANDKAQSEEKIHDFSKKLSYTEKTNTHKRGGQDYDVYTTKHISEAAVKTTINSLSSFIKDYNTDPSTGKDLGTKILPPLEAIREYLTINQNIPEEIRKNLDGWGDDLISELVQLSNEQKTLKSDAEFQADRARKNLISNKYGNQISDMTKNSSGEIDYERKEDLINIFNNIQKSLEPKAIHDSNSGIQHGGGGSSFGSEKNINRSLESLLLGASDKAKAQNWSNSDLKVENDEDLARTYAKEIKGITEEELEKYKYSDGVGKGTLSNGNENLFVDKSDADMRKEIQEKRFTDQAYSDYEEGLSDEILSSLERISNVGEQYGSKIGADLNSALIQSFTNEGTAINLSSIFGELDQAEVDNLFKQIANPEELIKSLGLNIEDLHNLGYDNAQEFAQAFSDGLSSWNAEDAAAQFKNKLAEAISIDAEEFDLDSNMLQEVAESFIEAAEAGDEMYAALKGNADKASDVARDYIRMNNAVIDLSENYDDYAKVLKEVQGVQKDADKAMAANSKTGKALKKSLSDLIGTSEKMINTKFLDAIDPKDFDAASKGDVAAIERIRNAFIDCNAPIGATKKEIDSFKNALSDLDEGATLDLNNYPFITKLIEAEIAAGTSAEDIQTKLSGMGIQCDLTEFTGTLEQAEAFARETGGMVADSLSMESEINPGVDIEQGEIKEQAFTEHYKAGEQVPMESETPEMQEDGTMKLVPLHGYFTPGIKTVSTEPVTADTQGVVSAPSVNVKTGDGQSGSVGKHTIINNPTKKTNNISSNTRNTAGGNRSGGKKGGGGGGGGKSNPAEKKQLTKKSDVVDRYKQINDKLNTVNKNMDKYNKLSEMAYGKNKLKSMDKILNAYKQQIKLQQQLKKEAEGYLPEDKKNMEAAAADLGTRKLQYDSDGNVKNIEAVQSDIFEKIHAAEEEYNSFATKEQQDEYNKATLEPLTKQYEEFKSYLSKYEDTKQQIADAEAAEMDAQIEYLDKKLDVVGKKRQIRMDVRDSEIKMFERELEKLNDQAFVTAERIGLLTATMKALDDEVMTERNSAKAALLTGVYVIDENGNPVKDKKGNLRTLGTSQKYKDMNLDQLLSKLSQSSFWENHSITETAAESLKNTLDSLNDLDQSFDDLKEKIDKQLIETFEHWTNVMQRHLNTMEHLVNMSGTWVSILEEVGKVNLGWTSQQMNEYRQKTWSIQKDAAAADRDAYDMSYEMFKSAKEGFDTIAQDKKNEAAKKDKEAQEHGNNAVSYENKINKIQGTFYTQRIEKNRETRKLVQDKLANPEKYYGDKNYFTSSKEGQAEKTRLEEKDKKLEADINQDKTSYKKSIEYKREIRNKVQKQIEEEEKKLQNAKTDKEKKSIQATIDKLKEKDTLYKNQINNLKAQQEEYRKLADAEIDLQSKMTDEAKGLRSEITALTEDLETMREEVRKNREKYLQDLLDLIQLSKENLAKYLDDVMKDFEQRVSGVYGSIEGMQEAFDQNKQISERYLQDTEKVYQLTKMNRDIEKKMDETTNLKAKEKLAKFQEDILKYAKEGVKMSEYDLEVMQKKYDLEVAKIALEESQNAKTQVRLTRDAEGNYSYTYTADENKTAEAEQTYEDKLNDLIKYNNEYQLQMQEAILNTEKAEVDAIEKLRQAYENSEITLDQFYAQAEQAHAFYKSQIQYYAQENEKASENSMHAFVTEYDAYYSVMDKKVHVNQTFSDDIRKTYEQVHQIYQNAAINRDKALYDEELAYRESYNRKAAELKQKLAEGKITQEEADKELAELARAHSNELDGINKTYTDELKAEVTLQNGTRLGASEYFQTLITGDKEKNSEVLEGMSAANKGFILDTNTEFLPGLGTAYEGATKTISDFANKVTDGQGDNDGTTLLGQMKQGMQEHETNVTEAEKAIKLVLDDAVDPYDTLADTATKDLEDIDKKAKETGEAVGNVVDDGTQDMSQAVDDVKNWYESSKPYWNKAKKKIDKITTAIQTMLAVAAGIKPIKVDVDTAQAVTNVNNLTKAYKKLNNVKNGNNDEGKEETPETPATPTQSTGLNNKEKLEIAKKVAASIWGGKGAGNWDNTEGSGHDRKWKMNQVFGDKGYDYIQPLITKWIESGEINSIVDQYLKYGWSWDKMKQYAGSDKYKFDTGGYTGQWGPDGRWALLHQKELILNAKDTENMLAAVKTVREIAAMVDLQAQQANLAGQYALALGQLPSSRSASIDQNVHITAEFPNVQDHNEVELALTSLVNRASQFAWRN